MDEEDLSKIFTDSESDEEYVLPGSLEEHSRRRVRGEPRDRPLEPEIQALIGEAQQLFNEGQHALAIKLIEEAIAADGSVRVAYNLLAAIYDEIGDPSKALTARVAATHLNRQSKDDWIEVSERSFELGLYQQAATFYQSASRLDRDDWGLLVKRAQLQASLGQKTRALSLLKRVRNNFFSKLSNGEKTSVLLELARVMRELGQLEEATDIYIRIFDASLDPARYGEPEVPLDWQNLNVLAELLYDRGHYARSVRVIKAGARWILGRGNEKWWQEASDDSEFDDRRHEKQQVYPGPTASHALESYALPIDIRIWLLVCRLKQVASTPSATEDALKHLEFLRKCQPPEDYSDLFARAAAAFFQGRMYEQALELYSLLTDIPYETRDEYLMMIIQVAKCQMQLGRIKEAESLYKYVVENDKDNVEALVALGEIYQATDRPALAKMMVDQVCAIRDSVRDIADGRSFEQGTSVISNRPGAFVDEQPTSKPGGPGTRLTPAERAEVERQAQLSADDALARLANFERGHASGNLVAVGEWIRAAVELITMFSSNRKFFPTDRSKGLYNEKRRSPVADSSLDEQDGANQDAEEENSASEKLMPHTRKFRGLEFDEWFILFMQTALSRARFESVSSALAVINTARASNIFNLDPEKEQIMNLVSLSCAYLGADLPVASETLRHMYMSRQFNVDILRLYDAVFSSGTQAMAVFGSSNNQKFFLRQIKAVDSVVQNREISGAARVINGVPITQESPMLFVLYAQIMLMSPSYVPALTYLMRALQHLPKDPVILLTIGVVHVQRAIQRVATNRHLQILQGLSYMQDYEQVRQHGAPERQEAVYNMGRLFHGLGLFNLALPYYEKVCQMGTEVDSEYDLSREAAYNMSLICALTGNMQLGRQIVDKYLEI